MSGPQVQLIEQNVKTNNEDIRELKKRVGSIEKDVSELKSDHQLTKQSVSHVLDTLAELKASFAKLDEKLDNDKEEQLKAYKSASWKVAIAIITAFFLIQLGLQ